MFIHERATSLAASATFFGVLAFVTTILRTYVRAKLIKRFWWDDGIMIFATLIYLVYNVFAFLTSASGTGMHEYDLTPRQVELGRFYWYLGYILYAWSLSLARVSIALFFIRISINKVVRYLVYLNLFGTIVSGIVYLFVVVFQCWPVNFYWLKAYPDAEGHCLKPHAFVSLGYLYGAVCIACDIGFVCIAILVAWLANFHWRTKLSVIPVLGMGGIACCCPIARMFYMHNIGASDFLYSSVMLGTLSTCETGLAISASCIATYRPLVNAISTWFYNRETHNRHLRFKVRSLRTITVTKLPTTRVHASEASDLPLTRLSTAKSNDAAPSPIETASSNATSEYMKDEKTVIVHDSWWTRHFSPRSTARDVSRLQTLADMGNAGAQNPLGRNDWRGLHNAG